MLTLKVGRPIPEEVKPKNAYVIECEGMFGDADGDTSVTLGPFQNPKHLDYLEEAIRVCERMKEAYPHGMGGGDTYHHVEGFAIWFGAEILPGMDENDPRFKFADEWPSDPQMDYQGHASFQRFSVYYFDDNGRKYDVNFKLS